MKYIAFILIIFSLLLSSCIDESFVDERENGSNNGMVAFAMRLPSVARSTGGLTEAHENEIQNIQVLLFNNETYLRTVSVTNIETDGTDPALRKFTISILEGTYNMTVLANAKEVVESANLSFGITKEAVLNRLTLSSNEAWNNAPGTSGYKPIPMSGEVTGVTVKKGTNDQINNVALHRMLAKIDVSLASTITNNVFELTSVYVYNYNNMGFVAPNAATPSIPSGAVRPTVPENAPHKYYITDGTSKIERQIYTFEVANPTGFLEKPCLVVGGRYAGNSITTYYRIDFEDASGFMHLVRNHQYEVEIQSVSDSGFPTPEEAFRARKVNMKVNIVEWNESVHNVVFDGQNFLSVSQNYFELSGEAHNTSSADNILKVATDYPTGWSAIVYGNKAGTMSVSNDKETGLPWLSISPNSGTGNGATTDIRLTTPVNNDDERTAYIHIKAGRLTYVVTVVQLREVVLPGTITVSPSEWLIPYTVPSNFPYGIIVTCKKFDGTEDPDAEWTLTSDNPSWLRMSLLPPPLVNFNTATASVNGKGSRTVVLYVTDNTGSTPRVAKLVLDSKPTEVACTVTQNPNLDNIPGEGTPPAGTFTYVGTFWRAKETGERIIRVTDMNKEASNRGAWTATVTWYSDKWKPEEGDGIVLSTDMLSEAELAARGISFSTVIANNQISNAENYQVIGTSTVSGVINDENPHLAFRIGLQKELSGYNVTTNPARYAVVLITYGTPAKVQKLFIRQGEGDDVFGGSRWSVYNLDNGRVFMDYPTKAGFFYQWGYGTNTASRTAVPYPPIGAAVGWTTNNSSTTQFSLNSAAPTNYAVPTFDQARAMRDAYTLAAVDQKTCWGYYADGWFDRRKIENAPGTDSTPVSSVSITNNDIAYMGRLLLNTKTNATLFFPTAGLRHNTAGTLTYAGDWGCYVYQEWFDSTNAGYLSFQKTQTGSWIGWSNNRKSAGYSVRVVRQ
ncbi:MAG: hypothetical protein LBI15_07825 [Dysgonamonadaceae bacterium]|jgi:hypothetical protein|nr:hypothetical protein [Dysgonamonadaceae bacterium]